jgi:hypothetical protein
MSITAVSFCTHKLRKITYKFPDDIENKINKVLNENKRKAKFKEGFYMKKCKKNHSLHFSTPVLRGYQNDYKDI